MPEPVRLLVICMLALAGGWVFQLMAFPAPWLAGAMVFAAAASLFGWRSTMPGWLRHLTFIALGLQVGASFTWSSLENFARWPVSLLILAATVVAMIACGTWFYSRVLKWDISTAFFSSLPGALGMALALADDRRADMPRVAVVQCIRLFALVAFFPVLVMTTGNAGLPVAAPAAPAAPGELALVCLAGGLGGYAAHRLRLPAGFLIGAMLANAALHLSGQATGSLPQWILVPAFVLLGTQVGIRFQDVAPARLKRLLGTSVAGFLVALALAGIGALAASKFTGLPLVVVLLAYAPGGLEVMTILAFALGLNPAFVATHQVARYLGLSLAMPMLSAIIHNRRSRPL